VDGEKGLGKEKKHNAIRDAQSAAEKEQRGEVVPEKNRWDELRASKGLSGMKRGCIWCK